MSHPPARPTPMVITPVWRASTQTPQNNQKSNSATFTVTGVISRYFLGATRVWALAVSLARLICPALTTPVFASVSHIRFLMKKKMENRWNVLENNGRQRNTALSPSCGERGDEECLTHVMIKRTTWWQSRGFCRRLHIWAEEKGRRDNNIARCLLAPTGWAILNKFACRSLCEYTVHAQVLVGILYKIHKQNAGRYTPEPGRRQDRDSYIWANQTPTQTNHTIMILVRGCAPRCAQGTNSCNVYSQT